jgi:rod shape-determining protein MreC
MRTKNIQLLCLLVGAIFLCIFPLQSFLRTRQVGILDVVLPSVSWFQIFSRDQFHLAQNHNILRMSKLLSERESFVDKIADLEQDKLEVEEIFLENKRLRKLLGFKMKEQPLAIVAPVVFHQTGPWNQGLLIDVTSLGNFKGAMTVIVEEGLVGRLSSSGDRVGAVQLITDPASRVNVMVQRSRAQGIFEPRLDGLGNIKYFTRDTDVVKGDLITTSGLGGVFRKGIRVGTVTNVKRHPGGLFKTVVVKPSVDFKRLEEVLCIPSA